MFGHLILVTFLLYSTNVISHATGLNPTICVVCGNDDGENKCQQYPKLSNLTVNETNCTNVQIYLEGGIHTLEKNLLLNDSQDNITIQGALDSPSTIQCVNNSGIVIRTMQYVFQP